MNFYFMGKVPAPVSYGPWTTVINYEDTKTKCRLYWCLIEFIDWRNTVVSHVDIFDPTVWTIAPLTFSLVHLPQPSPSQSQSAVCTDNV